MSFPLTVHLVCFLFTYSFGIIKGVSGQYRKSTVLRVSLGKQGLDLGADKVNVQVSVAGTTTPGPGGLPGQLRICASLSTAMI